jgi:hypothetical protein
MEAGVCRILERRQDSAEFICEGRGVQNIGVQNRDVGRIRGEHRCVCRIKGCSKGVHCALCRLQGQL